MLTWKEYDRRPQIYPIKWQIILLLADQLQGLTDPNTGNTMLTRVRLNPSVSLDGGDQPYMNLYYDLESKTRKNQMQEGDFDVKLDTYAKFTTQDECGSFLNILQAETVKTLCPAGAAIRSLVTDLVEQAADVETGEEGEGFGVHLFKIRYLTVFGNPYQSGR